LPYDDKLSFFDKTAGETPYATPSATEASPEPVPPGEPLSAAAERFNSCRWRRAAENGTPACCTHRDVLPMTGANGFDPDAWCLDCGFYKLRRTPKKRDYYGDQF
jgi:hypothetical protein